MIDVTENRPQKVSGCEGIFQITSVVNFIVIPRIRHVEKTQRNEWEQKEKKFTKKKKTSDVFGKFKKIMKLSSLSSSLSLKNACQRHQEVIARGVQESVTQETHEGGSCCVFIIEVAS